jgi:cyclic-di-GMP-binding protein
MGGNQSFDVTSGCDLQEVDNAINQALKEIRQRYDFKGLDVGIDFRRADNKIVVRAPDDFKLRAMWDIIQEKMIRRQVPLKNLQHGKSQPAAGGTVTQEVNLQQGIPIDTAKAIVKFIKELKIKKVQAEIQGEQVRVSSPARDDLQTVIGRIREQDFGVELKFGNYRTL